MPTYSKYLLIFILIGAFLLESEAHHCGCTHKKSNKDCKEKTTTTPTTENKCDSQSCNNANKIYCSCSINNYSLPESGNCDDVIKYQSTKPYFFNCHKMRKICNAICSCFEEDVVDQMPTLTPTLTTPTLCYPETCNNETEPFCTCGIDHEHYTVPETGNCDDVIKYMSTTSSIYYRYGFACSKVRTVCKVICSCSEEYIYDPTPTPAPTQTPTPTTPTPTPIWTPVDICDHQACNNVSKPYCSCGVYFDRYPMPKSGNCDDVKPTRPNGDYSCRKWHSVCKCRENYWPLDVIACDCYDEIITGLSM